MENLDLISGRIIAAAIEVHKHLGPGLLESVYEECLSFELVNGGLSIWRQEPVPVVYKEVKLECGYRIDILVEDLIVVELKSVESLLLVHQAQILMYLKFSRKRLGLLINFNETLLKKGLRRFIL